MQYDTVIVRYGEIFLKGNYVRQAYTKRLQENIIHALKTEGLKARIYRGRHRIYLEGGQAQPASRRAAKVLGVSSASPAIKTASDIGSITESVVAHAAAVLGNRSFAVRAKRSPEYRLTSMELEKRIGAAVQEEYGNKVNLSSPEVTLGVEAHTESAYVFSDRINGVGGLPYGTQGVLAAIVDNDKGALAAWLMMRRGCQMIAVGPGERAEGLSYYSNPDVASADSVEAALAAGALGLVLPQTLADADYELDAKLDVPVYRPLAGMDEAFLAELAAVAGL